MSESPHKEPDTSGDGSQSRPPSRPKPIQVSSAGLSDTPSREDAVGFAPYVRALAWFLTSNKTFPPLTISIEGPWGSGKSSFMLQLEDAIEQIVKERKQQGNVAPQDVYCVQFNAWRNDKDEALWAAFALTFMRQLARKMQHCLGTPHRGGGVRTLNRLPRHKFGDQPRHAGRGRRRPAEFTVTQSTQARDLTIPSGGGLGP
jgi:hypothetical protein